MRLAHGILTALLVFTTINLRAQGGHAKSIAPPPSREAFIANQGQWDPEARLLAPLNGLDVWVTSAGMTLDYYVLWRQGSSASPLPRQMDITGRPARRTGHIVRMEFSGASARAGACGADPLPGYLNYFLGNDPSRWVTHVNRFREARWTELYDGVDGRLRIEAGRPRYDLIVQPGADPTVIRIRFDGADGLRLNSNAELVLATSLGEVTQHALVAYQVVDARTVHVECRFTLLDATTVGFALGAYDATRPLIIDPLTSLAYSSFLGGSGGSNRAEDIVADSAGNLYVTGRTTTPQYPTTLGAYDTDFDVAPDAFVSKIAPLSGGDSDLVFSTFVGGNAWDYGYGIALDGQNNVYIAGITQSSNYPVSAGAYDSSYNGAEDAFVTKLDSSGSVLLYSTYLGGTGREDCYEIAVTPGGLAVVTGMTWWQSSGFPTTAFALQPSFGGGSEDAFLSVIAPLGNGSADLVYSTFLGGSGDERGFAVATEPIIGSLYVTGRTSSPNFHTSPGAYDTSFNGQEDIFVLKFIPTDVAGYQLSYGTYLGGPLSYDDSFGIAVDPTGAVYVAGYSFQFSGISGYP
ncbi:MAG TPA: SBBP repeat-containing protein, partial [Phycisphaerae bacterium]